MVTTMAAEDDNNEVNGNVAMGNNDGDGTTGDDNDGDSATGDKFEDDGGGTMGDDDDDDDDGDATQRRNGIRQRLWMSLLGQWRWRTR